MMQFTHGSIILKKKAISLLAMLLCQAMYMLLYPCKGNKLVELPEQYVHSSAKFYIENEQGIYAVTSYMELRDINLTNSRR